MSETKTYRLPFFTRFMMFAGTSLFGVVSYFSFSDQQDGAGYIFLGFAGLSLIAFIWSLYAIRITNQGIAVTNFLITKELRWNEVANVKQKADGFCLVNHDENISLNISAQVDGFFEVVEAINLLAPQAWNAQDVRKFHPSGTMISGLVFVSLFGIMMLYIAFKGFADGGENTVTLGFLFVLGIVSIGTIFLLPLRISIEDDFLVISRILEQHRINVQEVESVFMEQARQQNAFFYRTHVKLKNKKALQFSGFREGAIALTLSLQKWLKRYNTSAE